MSQIKLQPTDLSKAELLLNQMDNLLTMQQDYFTTKGKASRTNNPDLYKEAQTLLSTCKSLEAGLRNDLKALKGAEA